MEQIDFQKGNGLVPAVVQDADSGVVLMLGYMDEHALGRTLETGLVTFYSRSRERLWTKGEESGNTLSLVSLAADCDRDTLLVKARPAGPVCHTGADTCWAEDNRGNLAFLGHLQAVIASRKQEAIAGTGGDSYVASLFQKGLNKIAQKVGEEAVETVIEAKDSDDVRFLEESADLLFHHMVLLEAKGFGLQDVVKVLQARHQPPR
jgi:phosphoribosyl-ATP pyrophosphohydrolase/phosphoribosyl-AMP cyclohydrolase